MGKIILFFYWLLIAGGHAGKVSFCVVCEQNK